MKISEGIPQTLKDIVVTEPAPTITKVEVVNDYEQKYFLEKCRDAGVLSRQINHEWEHINVTNDKIKKAVEKAKGNEWLVMTGNTGTGKTMIATCMIKDAIKDGKRVAYDTAEGFRGRLNALPIEERYGFMQYLKKIDLLVIDEIGRGTNTVSFQSVFFEIINYRYNEYKRTVIISNYTERELFGTDAIFDIAFQRRFEEAGSIINFDFYYKKEVVK